VEQPGEFVKPYVQVSGEDGNIFFIAGRAARALRKAGYPEKANELQRRLQEMHSYDEALNLICEYCEVG
jgi:hypothetical protein